MLSTPVLRGRAFQLERVMARAPLRCQISWPGFAITTAVDDDEDDVVDGDGDDDGDAAVGSFVLMADVTNSSTEPDARLCLLMAR